MMAVEIGVQNAAIENAVEAMTEEMASSAAVVDVDNSRNVEENNTDNLQCNSCCSQATASKIYIFLCNFFLPFFVISTVGVLSYITDRLNHRLAFVFPSLGATAFLHFAVPDKPAASPRNCLIGHFIGVLAGSVSLQVTFLYDNDVVLVEGVNVERIFCAALSVAITNTSMVAFDVPHPPSAATTLIVSLGILKTPKELAVVMAAVLLLTLEAFVLNRLFRKDVVYPMWSVPEPVGPSIRTKTVDINPLVLENEMKKLTVDNFLQCFQLCLEMKNDVVMLELIQFATRHRDLLVTLDDYEKIIPYATRVVIENNCITNKPSGNVIVSTSGV